MKCEHCGETEFQLIRTEYVTKTKFIETGGDHNTVTAWIENDEPASADEAWYCVNGHQPTFDQQIRLSNIENGLTPA